MDPVTGVPNFVTCASGDISFMLSKYEPDVCVGGCARVRMCDHCPILVGTSVQRHTQYFLMNYHLLRVPEGANHGMSSKRLWLAATTGVSTVVSQRTDTMPACTVLVYWNIAAYRSRCNVIVMMGTR